MGLPALLLASLAAATAFGAEIAIVTGARATAVERHAAELLQSRIRDLTGSAPKVLGERDAQGLTGDVVLLGTRNTSSSIARMAGSVPDKPESFVISSASSQAGALCSGCRLVVVAGSDSRGVLYGAGHLLRAARRGPGEFHIPDLEASGSPAIADRGVYFATHFHNFYEGAPIGKLERYVEEMALWGFNAVYCWFDAAWFPEGFWNDPASPGMQMASRLRRIGAAARACGMQVGVAAAANESFRKQPPAGLLADVRARRGAFYRDSQICPSKPGGLEMIAAVRRRIADLVGPADIVMYWPYDPGGCGCSQCSNRDGWGRTFLRIGPEISRIYKEKNPATRFLISTWYMSPGERDAVYRLLAEKPVWADGIVSETRNLAEAAARAQAGLPRIVFPEISMFDSYGDGYGCNGANPAPDRFTAQAREAAAAGFGSALYSEGMYDDLNKFIWVRTLWDPRQTAREMVSEYSRCYFGPKGGEAGANLIFELEKTWGAAKLAKTPAAKTAELFRQAEALGAAVPRTGWMQDRWQALRDRAEMDSLMSQIRALPELTKNSRLLYEDAAYARSPASLRRQTTEFLERVKQRNRLTDRLFEANWAYLKRFHMDRMVLGFIPDQILGRFNWRPLEQYLEAALQVSDEGRMRDEILRAFKRWWWFNGITAENYFLL